LDNPEISWAQQKLEFGLCLAKMHLIVANAFCLHCRLCGKEDTTWRMWVKGLNLSPYTRLPCILSANLINYTQIQVIMSSAHKHKSEDPNT
jgi:hypothetical protein